MGDVKFRTESGSIYEIFKGGDVWMWTQLARGGGSGPHALRTRLGELVGRPVVSVGQTVVMVGPPIVPQAKGRMISTSPVVAILEGESD